MGATGVFPNPNLFRAHPNLSDAINGCVIRSEIEGGVDLRDLPPGSILEVHTRNRAYTIVLKSEKEAWISGHPEFCPSPVLVQINGSTWGGSLLKESYIGRGMHLEFQRGPGFPVTTSRIMEVISKGFAGALELT